VCIQRPCSAFAGGQSTAQWDTAQWRHSNRQLQGLNSSRNCCWSEIFSNNEKICRMDMKDGIVLIDCGQVRETFKSLRNPCSLDNRTKDYQILMEQINLNLEINRKKLRWPKGDRWLMPSLQILGLWHSALIPADRQIPPVYLADPYPVSQKRIANGTIFVPST
jgi:hypothetical protein